MREVQRDPKPRVGVVCRYEEGASATFYVNEMYVRALEMAGALPLLLPAVRDRRDVPALLEGLDGLLIPGGYDIDPKWWGDELGPQSGKIVPTLDEFELPLCRRALLAGLPVLGICRGAQTLNVAAGGTLYQDLASERPSPVAHQQKAPGWYPTHAIEVAPDSRLAQCLLSSTRVNSFHHQAVKDVAPGLRAVAWTSDGVIEAVEGTGPAFVLGVQWHPELMWERDPAYGKVFVHFVEACRANHHQVPIRREEVPPHGARDVAG